MANENFKISAALKDLIGRELITDEFVAVFELVKNSFDANATKVEVIFENNTKPNLARIIIKDNGFGMSYKDLKEKWLFVAYSAKKLGLEKQDYRDKIKIKRVFAGAKGVGRFSCDRLGNHLNLITLKNEPKSKIQNLIVNWQNFENVDDEEFINIQVEHKVLKKNTYRIKYGTVLEISGLRDEWNRDRILQLKRSLVKLINPNQENDSQNFTIEIKANDEKSTDRLPNKKGEQKSEWETVNGPIRNTIFETLEIKTSNILVQVSDEGHFIETTMQDRGDPIYFLKEKNPYKNLKNIDVYLFQLNRKAKVNFTRLMGMEPVKYGSVFLYKNGFRVYPYGEEGDDSLQIDRRKQQGYNRFLGTRDLIGRIEINGNQSELRETTSRDGGLIKTDAYIELEKFFYDHVLKRLENYVVNIIEWGDPKFHKETKELIRPELWPKDVKLKILELITGFINSKNVIDIQYDDDFLQIISDKQDKSVDKIVKKIDRVAQKSGNPGLVKEAKKIQKALKETKADVERAFKEKEQETKKRIAAEEKSQFLETQNSFLRNDISDDTKNLEAILHHIGLTTNLIKTDISNLTKGIINIEPTDKLLPIVKRLSRQNEKITSFSKYFKKVNFNIYTSKLKTDIVTFINEYIVNVYEQREDLKANRELLDVKIINDDKAKLEKSINPIDLIIIIDNLISNSTKHNTKKVILKWSQPKKDVALLSFKDDGKGVKDNIKDNIFDFGFTTSRRGSGIGLYHVREIMEKIKSKIEVNNRTKTGVEFLLTFNK